MMNKIKLCGLRRAEDIVYVNEARPDYVGFVFAESRRQVGPESAARLKAQLVPGIISVGVFVNERPEVIADLLNRNVIEMAQLHGRETRADIAALKQLTDRPIIKAVSVIDEDSVKAWQDAPADYLLFDHGKGGTGQSFDWNLMEGIETPFFLAGGINLENVTSALTVGAYALDISTGIETNGKKDKDKILAIVRRIRDEKR